LDCARGAHHTRRLIAIVPYHRTQPTITVQDSTYTTRTHTSLKSSRVDMQPLIPHAIKRLACGTTVPCVRLSALYRAETEGEDHKSTVLATAAYN